MSLPRFERGALPAASCGSALVAARAGARRLALLGVGALGLAVFTRAVRDLALVRVIRGASCSTRWARCVELEPPAPRLRRELRARAASTVTRGRRRGAAMRAEIAYYRAHHDEAPRRAGLADLRERCAGVLRDALPGARERAGDAARRAAGALRFEPYPEVPDVLRALRAAGVRAWWSSATGTCRCTSVLAATRAGARWSTAS